MKRIAKLVLLVGFLAAFIITPTQTPGTGVPRCIDHYINFGGKQVFVGCTDENDSCAAIGGYCWFEEGPPCQCCWDPAGGC